jgi:hypothetical protein
LTDALPIPSRSSQSMIARLPSDAGMPVKSPELTSAPSSAQGRSPQSTTRLISRPNLSAKA